MHIVFIYSNFNELGGVTSHMFQLKSLLEEKENKITTVSFSKGGDYNINTAFSKYHIINFSINLKIVNDFVNIIKKINPDVIHFHLSSTCMATARKAIEIVQKKLQKPVISTMHGYGISGCKTALYFTSKGKLCNGNASFFKCLECTSNIKQLFGLVKHLYITTKFGYIPYFNQFDYIIVPSLSLLDMAKTKGIDSKKLIHLPIFLKLLKII